jgi:hypothetical protein
LSNNLGLWFLVGESQQHAFYGLEKFGNFLRSLDKRRIIPVKVNFFRKKTHLLCLLIPTVEILQSFLQGPHYFRGIFLGLTKEGEHFARSLGAKQSDQSFPDSTRKSEKKTIFFGKKGQGPVNDRKSES